MLLSFSLANFRSFRDDQTLSMISSKRHSDHKEHLVELPDSDERLLRTAAIYGANGSGKSNLIKAIQLTQKLVLQGTPVDKPIPRQSFLLKDSLLSEPSTFQVQFLRDGSVFDYGLKVTDTEVVEEWLVLIQGTQETLLFERVAKNGKVHVELGAGLQDSRFGDHQKAAALAQVGTRANQLFLAAIKQSVDSTEHGPLISKVLAWFSSIQIVMPDANFNPLQKWVATNADFTTFAGRFLRDASTGVDSLRVDTEDISNSPVLLADFAKLLEDTPPGETRVKRIKGMGEVIVQRDAEAKVLLRTIRANHLNDEGKPVALQFPEESDGTQRLTHLLPALFQLKSQQRVFIIDEIDRSLHPLLVKKFVEFFLLTCKDTQSQLILTTHESNLMDLDLLRRDELWFAEKDNKGASSLYSLSNFSVRTDLKVDKGYLHGRFGAVPFLGNLDRFLEQLNRE